MNHAAAETHAQRTPPVHRVVLIGCGQIGLSGHLPALLAHPRVQLVGLCDLNEGRLNEALRLCGDNQPETSDDYRKLIADTHADACVVALHPEHSVDVVIDLLGRGIAVLDEKPLAVSIEQGLRVAAAVDESQAAYQVGFCFRYCEGVAALKRRVASLSRPRFYEVGVYDESLAQLDADGLAMICGILKASSTITHEGSHVIDWMSVIHGSEITAVTAHAAKTLVDWPGPNLWSVRFDYADASSLHLQIGWLLNDNPQSTFRVTAADGSWSCALLGEQSSQADRTTFDMPPLAQAWVAQLDAWLDTIDGKPPRGADVHAGIRALRATLAAELSFAQQRMIVIDRR